MITQIFLPNKKEPSFWKKLFLSIKFSKLSLNTKVKSFTSFLPLTVFVAFLVIVTITFATFQKGKLPGLGGDPVIKSMSQERGFPSEVIEIKGRRFGSTKPGDKVKFPGSVVFTGKDEPSESPEGIEAPILGWQDNKITLFIPPEAQSGLIYIINREEETLRFSNGKLLQITRPNPKIESLSKVARQPTNLVQIKGENFGNFISASRLYFPGRVVMKSGEEEFDVGISSWQSDQIEIYTPYQLEKGQLQVKLNYQGEIVASNSLDLMVTSPEPILTSVSKEAGLPLEEVTLEGKNLGQTLVNKAGLDQSPGQVLVDGDPAFVSSWGPDRIAFYLPKGAPVGNQGIKIGINYLNSVKESNQLEFRILEPDPKLTAVPASAYPSEVIGLQGEGLGQQISNPKFGVIPPGQVLFSPGSGDAPSSRSITAPILSWSETTIQVNVPPGVQESKIFIVRVAGSQNYVSEGLSFSPKTPEPQIEQLSPKKVRTGDSLDIFGTNLGVQMGTDRTSVSYPGHVYINDQIALPIFNSWNNDHIRIFVPWGSSSGRVKVVLQIGNQTIASNEKEIEIESLSPKIEKVTLLDQEKNRLTIRGENFGNPISNPYVGTFQPGRVFLSAIEKAQGKDAKVLGASRSEAKIEFWGEDKIIVSLPKNQREGWLYVSLQGSEGVHISNSGAYPQN